MLLFKIVTLVCISIIKPCHYVENIGCFFSNSWDLPRNRMPCLSFYPCNFLMVHCGRLVMVIHFLSLSFYFRHNRWKHCWVLSVRRPCHSPQGRIQREQVRFLVLFFLLCISVCFKSFIFCDFWNLKHSCFFLTSWETFFFLHVASVYVLIMLRKKGTIALQLCKSNCHKSM